jgi:hypothetical protein
MDLIALGARVLAEGDHDHPAYDRIRLPGLQVQGRGGRRRAHGAAARRARQQRRRGPRRAAPAAPSAFKTPARPARPLRARGQGLEALAAVLEDRHGLRHAEGPFGAAVDLKLGHAETAARVRGALEALARARGVDTSAPGARGRWRGDGGSGGTGRVAQATALPVPALANAMLPPPLGAHPQSLRAARRRPRTLARRRPTRRSLSGGRALWRGSQAATPAWPRSGGQPSGTPSWRRPRPRAVKPAAAGLRRWPPLAAERAAAGEHRPPPPRPAPQRRSACTR